VDPQNDVKSAPTKRVILSLFAVFLSFLMASAVPIHAASGQGSGSDGALGTQVPLTTQYSTTLHGNYVAAGVGLRDEDSGIITVTVPSGATIVKAFLIWGTMDYDGTPTQNGATLNGVAVTGTDEGDSGDLCWETNHYTVFLADVTGTAVSGANTITVPNPNENLLEDGASLVLIYSLTGAPSTQVILNAGAESFWGGYDEAPYTSDPSDFAFSSSSGAAAQTTYVVADAQIFTEYESVSGDNALFNGVNFASNIFTGADGAYWDTYTADVTSNVGAGATSANTEVVSGGAGGDCIGYSAQVLSVAVGPAIIPGVPQFGLPAIFVAAMSMAGIALLRRRLGVPNISVSA